MSTDDTDRQRSAQRFALLFHRTPTEHELARFVSAQQLLLLRLQVRARRRAARMISRL